MKGYTTTGVVFMRYLFLYFTCERTVELMVMVNGVEKEGYDGVGLIDVLNRESYEIKRVAVEINGEIISKQLFQDTVVKGGDHIEVVSFVGGG